MSQTHWIPVAQEQRVETLGALSDATNHVWVGLHGYGQLVQFFARHFRSLVTEERAFVFPQGPHKFYLNGVHGRVGASWMTKDERLVDIANQRKYLGFVFQWIKQQAPKATIHCVGVFARRSDHHALYRSPRRAAFFTIGLGRKLASRS